MISIGYVNFVKRSVKFKKEIALYYRKLFRYKNALCMILNQMFHEQNEENQYLKDTGTYAYFDLQTEVAIFH